jgi:hypothetical protein
MLETPIVLQLIQLHLRSFLTNQQRYSIHWIRQGD